MKKIKPPVADRIQTLRIQEGYTSQEMLAEKLGVTLDTVKAWEIGRRTPKGKNMEHLCRVLHTKEEYILNGDDSFNKTLQHWNKEHNPIIQFIHTAISIGFFHYSDPSDFERSQKEENDFIDYNKQYEERNEVIKMKANDVKIVKSDKNYVSENFETGEITIYADSLDGLRKAYNILKNHGIEIVLD